MLADVQALSVEAGGLVAVIGLLAAGLRSVVKVTRTIDKQLDAMDHNTTATEALTEQMTPLAAMVKRHDAELQEIHPRLTTLERKGRTT